MADSKNKPAVKPGMDEAEIRSAGLTVDVPYDTPGPQLERLAYADLGPGLKWTPPDGWEAGSGSGSATAAPAGAAPAGDSATDTSTTEPSTTETDGGASS